MKNMFKRRISMPVKKKLIEIWKRKRRQIIVILLFVISIFLRKNSIMIPIVGDFHYFRQSQTAITIQDFFNHGLSVLDYKTPIFGPPWQVPMEFPIYQISVFVLMKIFGMSNIDLGCRLASFIYFYLSAIAMLGLCKIFFKDSKIYLTILSYYLFSPYTLIWSRAAMPDFASVFFGLLYILFFVKWMIYSKKIMNIYFLLTMISGILGYLCKSTSMFPVVVVLAFFIISSLYDDFIRDYSISLINVLNHIKKNMFYIVKILSLCAVPVIIGLLWVKYSDFIKLQSIYTQELTSKSLNGWNYGTIKQKLSFDIWRLIFDRIHRYFAPYLLLGLLPISVYGLYQVKCNKNAIIFFMSMPIAVIFTLFSLINLYYIHDYYLIAVSPYVCIILGFAFYYVCFVMTKNKTLLKFIFFILFSISILQPVEYIRTLFYNNEILSVNTLIGDYLKETTNKNELIIVQDQDWSSALLYASNRRGFLYKDWSDIRPDIIFLKNNNFTTYVKKMDTEFDKNIQDSFDVTLEHNIYEWEIYKLSRLK